MGKYYVSSGEMEEVVSAPNKDEAARIAFERSTGKSLGVITQISEKSFAFPDEDDADPEALFQTTLSLLEQLGIEGWSCRDD